MGPLKGVKVVDLSIHLAGPYVTTIMGDMGADIIRIERPEGDEDREFGTPLPEGYTTLFACRARNKRSLGLNLQAPEGQKILKQLVKGCDVLLENYGPPIRKSLGVEYDAMKQVNPRLIMASVSAYGSWGPSRDKTGFDPIAQAASGIMSFTGFPDDDRPVRVPVGWIDYAAALHAAVGVMLALWHREKTGKGQHIDVSLYDTAVNLVGMQGFLTDYLLFKKEPPRPGSASIYAYADSFRAKDGWVFIHLGRNSMWRKFTQNIGKPELADDPRFEDNAKRVANRNLIDDIVRKWVAERTIAEVCSILEKARIPCQRINRVGEVAVDPHLRAREMLIDMDYPDGRKVPIAGQVIKLSETPGEVKTRAPLIGEHNDEILKELGYSPAQIAGLRSKQVIG